jgi:hypothetical protein
LASVLYFTRLRLDGLPAVPRSLPVTRRSTGCRSLSWVGIPLGAEVGGLRWRSNLSRMTHAGTVSLVGANAEWLRTPRTCVRSLTQRSRARTAALGRAGVELAPSVVQKNGAPKTDLEESTIVALTDVVNFLFDRGFPPQNFDVRAWIDPRPSRQPRPLSHPRKGFARHPLPARRNPRSRRCAAVGHTSRTTTTGAPFAPPSRPESSAAACRGSRRRDPRQRCRADTSQTRRLVHLATAA